MNSEELKTVLDLHTKWIRKEPDGSPSNVTSIPSSWDSNFIYRIGDIIEVADFDTNRWNECASGIHFFITRQEAVNY